MAGKLLWEKSRKGKYNEGQIRWLNVKNKILQHGLFHIIAASW